MQGNFLWLVGQFGILMELTGALYIALVSISIHSRVRRLFSNFDGWMELPQLVAEVRQQARTDIVGFLLLAAGLLLQFIGGFASS
jgi:hypothetical protein